MKYNELPSFTIDQYETISKLYLFYIIIIIFAFLIYIIIKS